MVFLIVYQELLNTNFNARYFQFGLGGVISIFLIFLWFHRDNVTFILYHTATFDNDSISHQPIRAVNLLLFLISSPYKVVHCFIWQHNLMVAVCVENYSSLCKKINLWITYWSKSSLFFSFWLKTYEKNKHRLIYIYAKSVR